MYAIASPRGASLKEKIVASMLPSFAWAAHQLYLVAGVYSLGETVYYGFSSAFVFVFCLVISSIGICELVFRMISPEQQLGKKKVLGPVMAILMGPLSVFFCWSGVGACIFFMPTRKATNCFFIEWRGRNVTIQEGKPALVFTLPDADGNIRKHWAKVANAADHPAKVLEVLKASL